MDRHSTYYHHSWHQRSLKGTGEFPCYKCSEQLIWGRRCRFVFALLSPLGQRQSLLALVYAKEVSSRSVVLTKSLFQTLTESLHCQISKGKTSKAFVWIFLSGSSKGRRGRRKGNVSQRRDTLPLALSFVCRLVYQVPWTPYKQYFGNRNIQPVNGKSVTRHGERLWTKLES